MKKKYTANDYNNKITNLLRNKTKMLLQRGRGVWERVYSGNPLRIQHGGNPPGGNRNVRKCYG